MELRWVVRTRYERGGKSVSPCARSVYRLLPHACVRIPSLQLRQAYVPEAYVAYAARGPPRSSIRGAQTRLDKRCAEAAALLFSQNWPLCWYQRRSTRVNGHAAIAIRFPDRHVLLPASFYARLFSHVNRFYRVLFFHSRFFDREMGLSVTENLLMKLIKLVQTCSDRDELYLHRSLVLIFHFSTVWKNSLSYLSRKCKDLSLMLQYIILLMK